MAGVWCPRCNTKVLLEQDGQSCSNCALQIVPTSCPHCGHEILITTPAPPPPPRKRAPRTRRRTTTRPKAA